MGGINRVHGVLTVDLEYSWNGVSPCPDLVQGCRKCPLDVCQDDEASVCDGSRYWECVSAAETIRWKGSPFTTVEPVQVSNGLDRGSEEEKHMSVATTEAVALRRSVYPTTTEAVSAAHLFDRRDRSSTSQPVETEVIMSGGPDAGNRHSTDHSKIGVMIGAGQMVGSAHSRHLSTTVPSPLGDSGSHDERASMVTTKAESSTTHIMGAYDPCA